MKCGEARRKLILLMEGELTPAEQLPLHVHLQDCNACRAEYLALQAVAQNVRVALHSRAEQVKAPPAAWHQLQVQLANQVSPPLKGHLGFSRFLEYLPGGGAMKRGTVWLTLVTLIAIVGVVFSVPSVRAQVGELLRWFWFESPAGGEVAVPGNAGFTPLRPTYLPAGFQSMAVGFNPEAASLSYWNSATQQVLMIDETLLTPGRRDPLPSGKRVTVNGQPAVLVTGVQRNVTFVALPPTPAAPSSAPAEGSTLTPQTVTADQIVVFDGEMLVWHADGVRMEMFSNLPEAEMLRIAESMAPAEEMDTTSASPDRSEEVDEIPFNAPVHRKVNSYNWRTLTLGQETTQSQGFLTFETTEQSSMSEIQSMVEFPILLPAYLPLGYEDMEIEVLAKDKVIIHFRFIPAKAAGARSLELYEIRGDVGQFLGGHTFQEVKLKNGDGILAQGISSEHPSPSMEAPQMYLVLYWEVNGLSLALRSYDLPVEEMVRIADSLYPFSAQ